MNTLLFSLGTGIVLIVVVNGLLSRFTALDAVQSALISVLAALGLYVPWIVLYWPGLDVVAIHLAVYPLTAFVCALYAGRSKWASSDAEDGGKKFHWGPAVIIGFFVFLIAVDSIFIMLAENGLSSRLSDRLLPEARRDVEVTSAFPGIVSHDFQEKEILFNAYLQRMERQRARGWQIRKGWMGQPVAGEPAAFRVAAETEAGQPLHNAEVDGLFLRPSDSRLDVPFTMQEIQPGVYQTVLNLPAAGRWDLVLRLRKDGELHEVRARTSLQSSING